MKSSNVTIQMKAFERRFHVVLCVSRYDAKINFGFVLFCFDPGLKG